ncbi:hypothetical protein FTUN_8210 [Frigoriglobus tundricola]|uniref:Uncharacterized protein n=1 Tax=Frigoriglobus tundricola TaxID=2774151 RepID=A0A6M5Z2E8_9BACT|nr:hypothetical protein FTUN_8210 [Frigoriglobus tundricola]
MRYRYRLSPFIWLVGFATGCATPDTRTTVAPFCPTTWNAHLPPVRTASAVPLVAQPALATGLARLPVVIVIRDDPGSPEGESKISTELLQASINQIPLKSPTLVEDREVVWTAISGPRDERWHP